METSPSTRCHYYRSTMPILTQQTAENYDDDDVQDGCVTGGVRRGRRVVVLGSYTHCARTHIVCGLRSCARWWRGDRRVGDRPSSDQVAPPPPPTLPPLSRRRGAHHWRYRPIATRVSCLLPIAATVHHQRETVIIVSLIFIIKNSIGRRTTETHGETHENSRRRRPGPQENEKRSFFFFFFLFFL